MVMEKKQTLQILALCVLMALLVPAVSAEACSFCEFINVSNITRGVTDHGLLTNLSGDGHPQYILTGGTRAFTGRQSLGGFNLTDLLDPVALQDAATKNYVDLVNASQTAYTSSAISLANSSMKNYVDTANASMQAYVDARPAVTDHGLLSNLSGDGHSQYLLVDGTRAMTGNLSMNSHSITGLATPSASTEAATKGYVDAHVDTAPGSDSQVIYNAGGVEAGNVNLTFANDTGTLTATAFVGDGSGLTGIGATAATALTFDVKAGTSALKKGQAVYISGAAGSNPIVSAADNTVTVKSRVVGLMIADTSANAQGKVRRAGTLTAVDTRPSNTNINPNGETWSAGDLLFATSGGGLTNVRPTSGRSVKAAYSLEGSKNGDTLLVYPMENPVWTTAAFGEDVVLRVGDSAGTDKVSVRNYTNIEVASVNSLGKGSFNGATMNARNISAVLDPVAAQDAATKNYVDTTNSSMKNYVDAVNTSLGTYANRGYSVNVMATASNPVDNGVMFFGILPAPPSVTAGQSKVYIRRAGTIRIAEIYAYSDTAGTGEPWGMSIRLNGATDYPIGANLTVATNERIWTQSSMNIPVGAGDYIQIKSVQPDWAVNPLTTVYGGYIYIE